MELAKQPDKIVVNIKSIKLIDEIPGMTQELDNMPERLKHFSHSKDVVERFEAWYAGRQTPREYPELKKYVKVGMDLMDEILREEENARRLHPFDLVKFLAENYKPAPGEQNVGRTSKSKKKAKKKNPKKKVAQPLMWC